jgi:hypothetical protein
MADATIRRVRDKLRATAPPSVASQSERSIRRMTLSTMKHIGDHAKRVLTAVVKMLPLAVLGDPKPPKKKARTPVNHWHPSSCDPNRIRTGVTAVRGPVGTSRRPIFLWDSANLQSSGSSTAQPDNVGICSSVGRMWAALRSDDNLEKQGVRHQNQHTQFSSTLALAFEKSSVVNQLLTQ